MGSDSSRMWANVVYVAGIAVLLIGCADFMISRAYVSSLCYPAGEPIET